MQLLHKHRGSYTIINMKHLHTVHVTDFGKAASYAQR